MGTSPEETGSSPPEYSATTPPAPSAIGSARHTRARWRHPYFPLLFLLLGAALALLLRPSIRGNDGVQNYAYLRSVLFDRDLDFANEYRFYFSQHAEWFDGKDVPRDPVTNRPINLYGIGNSLLWSPWVLVAHGIGLAANAFGAGVALDGYSRLYEVAVGLGSCVYASVGVLLAFCLLRRFFGEDRAFWSAIALWLASPLVFYMYLHPSMSHANSFFLASLLFWLYLGGDSLGRWGAMGAVTGLLVLTRFQDAVLLTALFVGELFRLRDGFNVRAEGPRFAGRRLTRYMLAGGIALLVFSPQFLVWDVLQGSALSGPRAYMMQGSLRPWAPRHLFPALFSSFHGLFYWHPVLLLGVAGFLLAPGRHPRLKLMALAAFAAQAWTIGSWSVWWAGASFGHRMFISTLPFLGVGLAAAVGRRGRWATLVRVMILLLVLWNFGLMAQYGLAIIPRQAPVPFSVMARNNLIELPRLVLKKIGEKF